MVVIGSSIRRRAGVARNRRAARAPASRIAQTGPVRMAVRSNPAAMPGTSASSRGLAGHSAQPDVTGSEISEIARSRPIVQAFAVASRTRSARRSPPYLLSNAWANNTGQTVSRIRPATKIHVGAAGLSQAVISHARPAVARRAPDVRLAGEPSSMVPASTSAAPAARPRTALQVELLPKAYQEVRSARRADSIQTTLPASATTICVSRIRHICPGISAVPSAWRWASLVKIVRRRFAGVAVPRLHGELGGRYRIRHGRPFHGVLVQADAIVEDLARFVECVVGTLAATSGEGQFDGRPGDFVGAIVPGAGLLVVLRRCEVSAIEYQPPLTPVLSKRVVPGCQGLFVSR